MLPKINIRAVVSLIGLVVFLSLVGDVVYQIAPEEVGVVQTFGEFTGKTDPGLHFKWMYPIQKVTKVPEERQLKQEFGFRTTSAAVRSRYATKGYVGEALMLTGDLNVGVVEWTTQYRVNDPFKYLFRVRNVGETFRDMNEAIMRTVVGDRSVSEVLTIGRQEIASEVETRLQDLCNQYEMGLKIEQVVLQDVNPPDPVKPSFNEVNQAQQERERKINDARTAFNKVVPRARGEALRMIQEAEGYSVDRINRAKGNAARFNDLLNAYLKAPEVTRRRIYLETMQKVLPSVRGLVVIDEKLKGILPLLPMPEVAKMGGVKK